MRGLGTAAVTLLIVLAIGCLAAAGASAAGPVWAYCAKASPKNTGGFSEKSCTTVAAGHAGGFELLDGIGHGKAFKGKGAAVRLLLSVPHKYEFNLRCNKTAISGRFVAPNRVAGVQMSMSKCETNVSPVEKSCVIHFTPLAGELGWIDQEKHTAGLELTSEAEPGTGVIAESQGCLSEVKQRWKGSVIAPWAPVGTLSSESTLTFTAYTYESEEKPTYFSFANLPGSFEAEEAVHFLTSEVNGPGSNFEWTNLGAPSAGIEGAFASKGEALMVH
jgi:hypothetical protein